MLSSPDSLTSNSSRSSSLKNMPRVHYWAWKTIVVGAPFENFYVSKART